MEAALQSWQSCGVLAFEARPFGFSTILCAAFTNIGLHYLDLAFLARETGRDPEPYLKAIAEVPQVGNNFWQLSRNRRLILVSYYSSTGQSEKARSILKADMKVGINLLSDDGQDNDDMGYLEIAILLLSAGDELNA